MERIAGTPPGAALALGRIVEVRATAAEAMLDAPALALARDEAMPPGAVGSHLKVRVGQRWVVAQVRTLRLAQADGDRILAGIDCVGEGDDADGKLGEFRRGVTRMPMPGDAAAARRRRRTARHVRRRRAPARDRSARSTRPTTFRRRSTSTRCSAGISPSWAPPAAANRPPPRSCCTASAIGRPAATS